MSKELKNKIIKLRVSEDYKNNLLKYVEESPDIADVSSLVRVALDYYLNKDK